MAWLFANNSKDFFETYQSCIFSKKRIQIFAWLHRITLLKLGKMVNQGAKISDDWDKWVMVGMYQNTFLITWSFITAEYILT